MAVADRLDFAALPPLRGSDRGAPFRRGERGVDEPFGQIELAAVAQSSESGWRIRALKRAATRTLSARAPAAFLIDVDQIA